MLAVLAAGASEENNEQDSDVNVAYFDAANQPFVGVIDDTNSDTSRTNANTTTICKCADMKRCAAIMKEWSKLGDEYKHMTEHVLIPPRLTEDTAESQHSNDYHDGCKRLLHGKELGAAAVEVKATDTNCSASLSSLFEREAV